jgi:hypothetical protein
MNPASMDRNHAAVLAALLALVASSAGCEKNEKAASTQTSAAAQPTTVTTTAAVEPRATAATPAPTAARAEEPMAKPMVTWKGVGLSTPESVLHDDATDVYLVSNVEGQPTEADGKGFISKLATDGTVTTLKWIESGKNKVTLNAPKGLGIVGDRIYVADIDTVRIFDRNSGAPAGEVKIPGATFLNDIATTTDGRVLVSDTGMKGGAKGMESSGTDAVYSIDKDKKVTTIAKTKELGGPNGLAVASDGKIWVAAMSSGEIYSLDAKGKRGDIQKPPKGSLDGLLFLNGDLVVSSWDGSAVYRGKPGAEMKTIVEGVKSPADIGYDMKRSRLLVPLFNENEVRAYDLK